MIRKPTYEEAQRIAQIVSEVEVRYKPDYFDWKEHKPEAYALLKSLGHRTPSKSCFSCWIKALDQLRVAISLPPLDHGATESQAARRMALCEVCPAFHPNTQSCGRFILDAINPVPVQMEDGTMIEPCGCNLFLKTKLRRASCPAKKW